MFDVSWSEFLILAMVALIFIGPKDLPKFFNTLGRYAGVVRRQAAEFRQYFEEAMREAELDQLKKEVESVKNDVVGSLKEAHKSASVELDAVREELKGVTASSRFDAVAQLKDKGEVPVPLAQAIADAEAQGLKIENTALPPAAADDPLPVPAPGPDRAEPVPAAQHEAPVPPAKPKSA